MLKKNYYIKDLRIDQKLISEPFSLKEFEEKLSRQGKTYLNVKFGDKTGEIRGKVWTENLSNIDKNLKVGDIVLVFGEIQEYNGSTQLIASGLKKAIDFPPDEFLEKTTRDISSMVADLDMAIERVQNKHLKALLDKIWIGDLKDKLINYPGGEYVHHGYVGGLLEHLWEMHKLSLGFIEITPKLDKDLVLAGILTHDIGKTIELEFTGTAIIRNTEGKLLGHLTQGLLIVSKMIDEIKEFPEDLKTKLLHLVISHNGSKETGSPVQPQMIEALVLFLIDKSSADLNMAVKQIEKDILTGSDFSDYNKWLKASMYQKDYLAKSND